MNTIQNIILPGIKEITAPNILYFHGDYIIFQDKQEQKQLRAKQYKIITANTYFNSLSLDFWRQKTNIGQIALCLYGQGKAQLKIKVLSLESSEKTVFSTIIELSPGGTIIPLISLRDLPATGMLYPELTVLSEEMVLSGGQYLTEDVPVREIKLGIVITHFNRKHYVLPAIARISQQLLANPAYRENITLVVVDNSSNIGAEEAGLAVVLPNRNLGGSGGFTRGLMYLQDTGGFTHCLFMDDDASCETESIIRAFHAAQYAVKEIAVCGALLRENAPDMIHEKGAYFARSTVQAAHGGMQVGCPQSVLLAEKKFIPVNYGAWWFFLFPVGQVKYYAYPFFIRGDDILFSLQNQFEIVTLNGVHCWGEDFSVKENPLTCYLGFRGASVCSVVHDKYAKFHIVKLFLKWVLINLFSYNYASARALLYAMEDLQKGSQFIANNTDAAEIFRKILPLAAEEKLKQIDKDNYCLVFPRAADGFIRKNLTRLGIALTLNGHLLPDFMLHSDAVAVYQPKGFRAYFRQIFRYSRVLYINELNSTGYIAGISRGKCLAILIRALKLSMDFLLNYKTLAEDLRQSSIQFTSRSFWEKEYQHETKK